MNDRLAELKVGMPSAGADIEAGVPASAQSPAMTSFFEEVNAVKKSMQTIKYNIRLIEQSHGECLTAISSEQQRECTDRLEGLMKETNGAAQTVRNKLKAMDLENKEFAKRNEGASEARIRSNMHGTMTRKFVDLMAEYQEIQTKYKNKYRDRVERQLRIVKPTATKDEIEQAVEGGEASEIFTQQFLQGPGHAAARNALADIQERPDHVMMLGCLRYLCYPVTTPSAATSRRGTRTSRGWRRPSRRPTSSNPSPDPDPCPNSHPGPGPHPHPLP